MTKKYILFGLILLLLYNCNKHNKKQILKNDNIDTSNNTKMYPSKFNTSNLTIDQKQLLSDFAVRRKLIDDYIKVHKLKIFTCPGCGFPTLDERGEYYICKICYWEDNYQDDPDADEIRSGPNGKLSLTENRLNIGATFKHLEDSLNGKLISDPTEIIRILDVNKKRLDSFEEKKENELMTAKPDDPIWKEWETIRQKTLIDMVKK